MRKTIIALIVGAVLTCVYAAFADKFIYTPGDGAIICDTPSATIAGNGKILGAKVWPVSNGSPALGESDDLWTYVDEEQEAVDAEGNVTTATVTNKYIRKNVSEMTSFTKLYPLSEDERQAAKSLTLREVEQNFMNLCAQLGSQEKLGFSEISAILDDMEDRNAAIVLSLKLLAIDAEGKREGGLNWWDDCAVHPELAE